MRTRNVAARGRGHRIPSATCSALVPIGYVQDGVDDGRRRDPTNTYSNIHGSENHHLASSLSALVGVAALVCGTVAGAGPVVAAETDTPARYYLPPTADAPADAPAASTSSAGTERLDPGTIGLCNAGFGDVSVQSWDDTVLGHVDLSCGDSASGYIHIRDGDGTPNDVGHEAEWQAVVDSFGGGMWDDFMVHATGAAIVGDKEPDDHGADKLCFSAPVEIFQTDGTYITTYYPTILASANNKRIITSYPTHYQSEC